MFEKQIDFIRSVHEQYLILVHDWMRRIPYLEEDTDTFEIVKRATEGGLLYSSSGKMKISAFKLLLHSAAEDLIQFWEDNEEAYLEAVQAIGGSKIIATSKLDFIQCLYWDSVIIPNTIKKAKRGSRDSVDQAVSIACDMQELIRLEDLFVNFTDYPPIIILTEKDFDLSFEESIQMYRQGTLRDSTILEGYNAFVEAIGSISKMRFDPITIATEPSKYRNETINVSEIIDISKLRQLIVAADGGSGFEYGTDPRILQIFNEDNPKVQFSVFSSLLRHVGDLFQTESFLSQHTTKYLRTISHPNITKFSFDRAGKRLADHYSLTADHVAAYSMVLPELTLLSDLSPKAISDVRKKGVLIELHEAFRSSSRDIQFTNVNDFAEVAISVSRRLESEIAKHNADIARYEKSVRPSAISGSALLAGIGIAGFVLEWICPPLGQVFKYASLLGATGTLPAAYCEVLKGQRKLDELESRPIGILANCKKRSESK